MDAFLILSIVFKARNDAMTGRQLLQLFLKMARYLVHHRLVSRGKAWCELHCEIMMSVRCCVGCLALVQESGACVQMALDTMNTSRARVKHGKRICITLGLVLSFDEFQEARCKSRRI
ncbi:hypothetical protein PsorP6_008273 [Peronosclerospora sorghi]|uniref:Uncharacterized protein n=1 Tax=Peronosclerospora sorghi TaxID=230839 RepID=A0ACC0W6Y6_9STRA|nr:hypothetical protein PsorP6_008273 [Peronosclerospora sorghi]